MQGYSEPSSPPLPKTSNNGVLHLREMERVAEGRKWVEHGDGERLREVEGWGEGAMQLLEGGAIRH